MKSFNPVLCDLDIVWIARGHKLDSVLQIHVCPANCDVCPFDRKLEQITKLKFDQIKQIRIDS